MCLIINLVPSKIPDPISRIFLAQASHCLRMILPHPCISPLTLNKLMLTPKTFPTPILQHGIISPIPPNNRFFQRPILRITPAPAVLIKTPFALFPKWDIRPLFTPLHDGTADAFLPFGYCGGGGGGICICVIWLRGLRDL